MLPCSHPGWRRKRLEQCELMMEVWKLSFRIRPLLMPPLRKLSHAHAAFQQTLLHPWGSASPELAEGFRTLHGHQVPTQDAGQATRLPDHTVTMVCSRSVLHTLTHGCLEIPALPLVHGQLPGKALQKSLHANAWATSLLKPQHSPSFCSYHSMDCCEWVIGTDFRTQLYRCMSEPWWTQLRRAICRTQRHRVHNTHCCSKP